MDNELWAILMVLVSFSSWMVGFVVGRCVVMADDDEAGERADG